MSQAQLAEVTGISQPNLSAYENDRRVPTADTLNRMVVACGYQLAAIDDRRVLFCPLPLAGWFPDEDRPPSLKDDPPDERPAVTADRPIEVRVNAILAVLEMADTQRS